MLLARRLNCTIAYCLCMSFAFLSCSPSQNETDVEVNTTKEQEWQTLFNGETLENWNSTGSADARVEEQQLILRRNADAPGWLISNAQPANFELKTEFKLSEGTNSGVAIRVPTKRNVDPVTSGYEVNLDNRADIPNPSGTLDFLARAFWNEDIDPQGWNQLHVKADGDHIEVKVNGKKVVETFSRRSSKGAIALQAPLTDTGEVRFRQMQIKELPPSSFSQPQLRDYMLSTYKGSKQTLFDGESLNGWQKLGEAKWSVAQGIITGDSQDSDGGYLCTDKTYKNFYLSLQFKIAFEDNSGVFVRLQPDATEVSLDVGLEVNVYDAPGMEWAHPTGSINTHARAFTGLISYEEWNTMEIFAFDEQLSVYVNGVKASEATVPTKYQEAGKICLQVYPRVATDEGPSQVSYKNIQLKNFEGIPFVGY